METKYSAGPYAVGDVGPMDRGRYTRDVIFANGQHIGTSGPGIACGVTQEEADANAALFADAPTTREALRACLEALRLVAARMDKDDERDAPGICARARTAITTAEKVLGEA